MDFQSLENLKFIDYCLAEDLGTGDHSSLGSIPNYTQATSNIYFKANGIIAGIDLCKAIINRVDPLINETYFFKDGDSVLNGTTIAQFVGNAHSLLKIERLILNFMQRLSGIATTTFQAVNLVKQYPVVILDTRKTTPGLRFFEKWAVTMGGAVNHRMGLYDMVMLKDNHVDSAGSITKAVNNTFEYLQKNKLNLKIEVETRNLNEVNEAILTKKVDRIMLDNFNPELCKQAVDLINNSCETEASGGINLSNLKQYAATGVTYISLGFLTHSYTSVDISMKTKLNK